MEAPLSGSNNVILNRISNLDQAAAGVGKLFLISEDRVKILASLARQVSQMCEELYDVEIMPSETAPHVHWPSTQQTLENVHNGDVTASAAVTNADNPEEIALRTAHPELRLGDEPNLSTIQSEHSFPVLEETMDNTPKTNIENYDGEGNILLDPGGSGGMNGVAQTQSEMMEPASAMKVDDDISNESSKWQMPPVKIEHCSDTDPANDLGVNNVTHTCTQPEMMESPSATMDKDISGESSEWQITNVRTEQDTDTGNNIGTTNVEHIQPEMMNSGSAMKVEDDISNEGPEWHMPQVKTEHNTDRDPGDSTSVSYTQPEMMESSSAMIAQDMSKDSEQPMPDVETGHNSNIGYYKGDALTQADLKTTNRETVSTTPSAVVTINSGERPYQCQQCGKTFSKERYLRRHIRDHTREKPYKCQECDKTFLLQSSLRKHMIMHTGEKPYKCPDCGKHFARQHAVNRHRKCHTGEKPYKCQECNKTFAQQKYLSTHMTTHTGEKPHKCLECGNTYTQKSSLQLHMRRHTGVKPYKCQECGKTFDYQGHLSRHMKTHTGEKNM